jgi:hypothetical protein
VSDDYYQRVQEIIQQEKATRPPPKPPRDLKLESEQPKRLLAKVLAGLVVAAALIYLADLVDFHVRKNSVGQATVQVYYAIGQKNGKTELAFQDARQVNCANTLFPHAGMSACWWLSEHPEQRIDFFKK